MPRSPLRTGLEDLPHPALQIVVCSISETDDFRDFGFQQAKEPKFAELVVRPALVVSASTSTSASASAFAAASLSQDGSQSHAYPSVDASKFAVLGVFEVAIPTGKRPVDVRHDGFHALAGDPPRLDFFEYDAAWLKTGRGLFWETLPDHWGRLVRERYVTAAGLDPAGISPHSIAMPHGSPPSKAQRSHGSGRRHPHARIPLVGNQHTENGLSLLCEGSTVRRTARVSIRTYRAGLDM